MDIKVRQRSWNEGCGMPKMHNYLNIPNAFNERNIDSAYFVSFGIEIWILFANFCCRAKESWTMCLCWIEAAILSKLSLQFKPSTSNNFEILPYIIPSRCYKYITQYKHIYTFLTVQNLNLFASNNVYNLIRTVRPMVLLTN